MSKRPIYFKTKGSKKQKLAGNLLEEGDQAIFIKKVKRAKHYMRVVKGYGIQQTVFDDNLADKKGWVWIYETDTDTHLLSPIENWKSHSKSMEFNKKDGRQIFLSQKYMDKVPSVAEAIQHMSHKV